MRNSARGCYGRPQFLSHCSSSVCAAITDTREQSVAYKQPSVFLWCCKLGAEDVKVAMWWALTSLLGGRILCAPITGTPPLRATHLPVACPHGPFSGGCAHTLPRRGAAGPAWLLSLSRVASLNQDVLQIYNTPWILKAWQEEGMQTLSSMFSNSPHLKMVVLGMYYVK